MIEIPDKPMTIRETSELTGLTEDTLRYYERIDLLPPAERKPNGHRFYTSNQVQSIIFLMKLKSIGMTLEEMKQFRMLVDQGDGTIEIRKSILESCRRRVDEEIERLRSVRKVLDYKMSHYDELRLNPSVDDRGCDLSSYE
ncbi:MerR family transcriptional regulator [Saccharibacillus alkalitolerans]|uniref:MerR family transcriptional regulator n=1 Tax=Saccharibacillus alkalitolerans TaxID=2705290 RepID=A0ABX0F8H7_9BACL|nr:MerR family transcriptional regulator [Saccharibacillus alkalitolerans]NGZ77271.1 MerR family transcriptional regulator [Saccharibacillus alkalitolerans]